MGSNLEMQRISVRTSYLPVDAFFADNSEDVNMDYSLFERHATLVKKPQVMIIPSELKQVLIWSVVYIVPGGWSLF